MSKHWKFSLSRETWIFRMAQAKTGAYQCTHYTARVDLSCVFRKNNLKINPRGSPSVLDRSVAKGDSQEV